MSNSTHVKIGKVWWPRKALEGARFVENNDGVIVPVGLSNGDHPFEGQEAADLRAWLAGEPVAVDAAADNAAADVTAHNPLLTGSDEPSPQKDRHLILEDMAHIWDEWLTVRINKPYFSKWLYEETDGSDTSMLFFRANNVVNGD